MQKNSERLKKFYKWWLPVYKLGNKRMCANYRTAMPMLLKQIDINNKSAILDVGTGTGGFAGILLDCTSARITGIDFSPEMLNEARKTYGNKINFINLAAHELTQFETASFNFVTAAFSLHDMDDEYRLDVLRQMQRVASEKVVIAEWPNKINPIARFIEFLEGSYYQDFAKHINTQLASVFPKYEEIPFSEELVIYICDV